MGFDLEEIHAKVIKGEVMTKAFKITNNGTVDLWLSVHFSDGTYCVSSLEPGSHRTFCAMPGEDLAEVRMHESECDADAAGPVDRCRGKVKSL